LEAEIREIRFETSLGKMFTRSYLNQWLGMVACTCHPAMQGSINRRIEVQACLGIKQDPISKIFNARLAK
jgi:hypothetical protein